MKKIVSHQRFKKILVYFLMMLFFLSSIVDAKKRKKEKRNTVRLHISGADGALKKNIEDSLSLGKPECKADQARIERYLDTLEKKLTKAARPIGYYDAKFTLTPRKEKNCWHVDISAIPGQIIRVRKQEIKIIGVAKDLKKVRVLASFPPYKIGEQLVQDKYEKWKKDLLKATTAKGYLGGEFETNEIRINLDTHQADIVLHFNTGEVYRFGKISVEQSILNPKYMRRFIQLKSGEIYSNDELTKQQQYLQSTGYFSEVLIQPDYKSNLTKVTVNTSETKQKELPKKKQQADDLVVPVNIKLIRRKRNTYEYRIGYGTGTGARMQATLDRHWTGSKGRKFKAKVKLSEVESLLEATYIVPLQHPQTEYVSHALKLSQEESDDIRTRGVNFKTEYTQKNSGGFTQTASVKYLFDYTKTTGDPFEQSKFTLLGASVAKTTTNHPVNPTKGHKLKLALQGGHQSVLSDDNFVQMKSEVKVLQPLSKGKVIARIEVGATVNDNFTHLPKSLRFFAGGNNSVRGYAYESLGETNSNGKNIGGKHLLTSSLEYEHPVKDKWGAAIFVDAGSAFNSWKKPEIKTGVGVGVRWASPIGPVKVDLAVPEDDLQDPHFYLNVGTEF